MAFIFVNLPSAIAKAEFSRILRGFKMYLTKCIKLK